MMKAADTSESEHVSQHTGDQQPIAPVNGHENTPPNDQPNQQVNHDCPRQFHEHECYPAWPFQQAVWEYSQPGDDRQLGNGMVIRMVRGFAVIAGRPGNDVPAMRWTTLDTIRPWITVRFINGIQFPS